ncbi:MAG: glycosyltransferase family 2 protein [Chitinophagales bacterium]|nr:glycosyltransferase family 2 protein [Chitinophagales bacterium]
MYAIQELVNDLFQEGCIGDNISFLLIDDGSQDDTASVIQKLSQKYPRIQCVIHESNMGFGYTIREAITTPKTGYVLYLSGDNQFRSDSVKKLLDFVHTDSDYVIAIRNRRSDNFYRRFVSKTYNTLISIAAKMRVKDVNSIFLVKRNTLEKISLNSSSAFIHAEIFLKLKQMNTKCEELSITHYPRVFGKGSGGKFSVIFPTFIDLLKYKFRL